MRDAEAHGVRATVPVLVVTKGMLASRVAFTIAGMPLRIMTLGICMIPCAPCARSGWC
jgi:hypothetical protein